MLILLSLQVELKNFQIQSSFLLLLLQGQEDWRRIEGLPSLDWGLLSLCVSPPAFSRVCAAGSGLLTEQ